MKKKFYIPKIIVLIMKNFDWLYLGNSVIQKGHLIHDIIISLIILFYIYKYIFTYTEYEQYQTLENFILGYIFLLIIISKYNLIIALSIFIISGLYILYLIYGNNNNQNNNNQNNTQYNNNYQFNHDPNVKLNRDDVINLGKLIDSKKTLLDKCRIGFGVNYSNKNKKKCRSLLKKYHDDRIDRAVANKEERNKINVQFNECCF
mgnify:CR=1 FL=1